MSRMLGAISAAMVLLIGACAEAGFGAWQTRQLNTVYLAESDGFVLAGIGYDYTAHETSLAKTGVIAGYTDGGNPPTTIRGVASCSQRWVVNQWFSLTPYNSFTMPVKKGDYWGVTAEGTYKTVKVYWIPLE